MALRWYILSLHFYTLYIHYMKTNFVAYFATLVPLLALDALWLTMMAKRFYAPRLGSLMAASPNFLPAGIFYVAYAAGIVCFVVLPGLKGEWGLAKFFLLGAFFGGIAYATYDLTNQATLRNWPLAVTAVDLVWGAVLTGVVSCVAALITRALK